MLAHEVALRDRMCVPTSGKDALGSPAMCGVEDCRTAATVVEMKASVHGSFHASWLHEGEQPEAIKVRVPAAAVVTRRRSRSLPELRVDALALRRRWWATRLFSWSCAGGPESPGGVHGRNVFCSNDGGVLHRGACGWSACW